MYQAECLKHSYSEAGCLGYLLMVFSVLSGEMVSIRNVG